MSDIQPPLRHASNATPAQTADSPISLIQENLELELKLTAEPDRLEAAWKSPALTCKAGREVVRQLETIYYDTADQRLRRRGLALRVRKEVGRFVQTVKAEGDGVSGVFCRGEFSAALRSHRPDLGSIQDTELRNRMGLVLESELVPIFTTRIERRKKNVRTEGPRGAKAIIEVALDQGEVSAKDGKRPISELELELVEGSIDELCSLAAKLNEEIPLALETVSKSERGYALATGQAVSWAKAEDLAFEPQVSLDGAIGEVFRACMRHWLANHAAVLESSDPEGVHQLRVALRRLRSALSVFKGVLPAADAAWINGEARWLAQSLGAARDWDVFLTQLLPPLQAASPANGNLEALQAAAEDARQLAYEHARSALRSARYTAFVLDLVRWIHRAGWRDPDATARYDELLADYACRLLRGRHRRVLKQGRNFESLPDEDLHRLRITLKKLRYTSEFFASLYPKKKARPCAKALRSLQEELGHMNDSVVVEDLLKSLFATGKGSNTLALRAAAGMAIGWYAHALATSRPAIDKSWRAFAATKPFWNAS